MPMQFSSDNKRLTSKDLLLRKLRNASGCWEWIGYRTAKGYGRFAFRNSNWHAHRAAWTLLVGEIPEGMCILHRCDNPPCCNPEHLFLGTKTDNHEDMVNKNRRFDFRGEDHGMSKLNLSQVVEIRSAYLKGGGRYKRGNSHELAARFSVSRSTICRIATHKIWK